MLSDGTYARQAGSLEYWRLMFPMRILPALLSHCNADEECMYRVEPAWGHESYSFSSWFSNIDVARHFGDGETLAN
jgi:hypothetical protein